MRLGFVWVLNNTWTLTSIKQSAVYLLVPKADSLTVRKTTRRVF